MVDHSEAGEYPVQTDEQRKAALSGVPSGQGSASGKERARLYDDTDKDIPSGDDGGSKVPIAGGDSITAHEQVPVGGQAQPAIMTSNGSVPIGMVGSPGGPVPVGLVTSDHKEAVKLLQDQIDSSHAGKGSVHEGFTRISRAQIEQASSASLRAAAHDRGWDIGEGGARVTRARFITKQNEVLGGNDDPTQAEGEGAPETTA